MRATTPLLIVAFLLLSLGIARAAGIVFTSPEGRFRVVFPEGFSDPRQDPGFAKMQSGAVKGFLSKGPTASMCMVAYRDLERVPTAAGDLRKFLAYARDSQIKQMKATPGPDRSFTMAGNPGLSYSFVAQMGGRTIFGQESIILARHRMFFLRFASENRGDLSTPASNGFFSSFEVLK